MFTWCSLQLFQRYSYLQILYICATDTSDILIVSTKAHCYQSNVSRNPQSGVQYWKKETLFRWTVCKPGKHSPCWKWKAHYPETKGKLTYIEEVFALVPDRSISIQMRNANFHNLTGPNSTVMIGWNHMSWLVNVELLWFVDKDVNEDIAS